MLEEILSEQEEFLNSLQDANDAGLPAGIATGTPETLEHGAAAALGDPTGGWVPVGHVHALSTAGTARGVGLTTSKSVASAAGVAAVDHRHGIEELTTEGDILYVKSGPALERLGIGSAGQVLAVSGGVPAWSALSALALTQLSVTTPAQLAADVNDYDLSAGQWARVSSDASRNVTGILAEADGTWKLVTNVGANNVVLQHQNAGSSAANRILSHSGADITLAAEDAALLIYDDTTDRWRAYAL